MKFRPIRENPHIYTDGRRLYTKNLIPGQKVYGERIIREKGEEYREWIVNRSKLAAAIKKRIKEVPIKPGDKILYLGIAAGTTASHISDIIGWDGVIFGIDVAPRIMRELIPIVKDRKNIIPILEDASKPDKYLHIVSRVDLVYEDVAQPHQVDIFIRNIDYYLRGGGYGFLAVKARSIDVTKNPKVIFRDVEKQLREYGFRIIDVVRLDPYHKDHAMFLIQNK
ncbi:MAG TPA: fibrillarin-like rRNA/tRNA 2'-O-methyltransferase [Candidatus Nanopusillus sp.]|nr:fibrillarin-like rRNA/tRNA 2'-O-methyltransferase [Candidatus Nanopusillus sp.]HIP90548.1 fibrillarin-like rRNA/tRNA 2'-O-methyltransferase [Candidatus Nanopusillus sp.]